MRPITITLAILLLVIQYPLWLGKGGWLRVFDLHRQLESVQEKNEDQKAKNAKLASEVLSLKDGTEAIEERARSELSMIKKGEVFIQLLNDKNEVPKEASPDVKTEAKADEKTGEKKDDQKTTVGAEKPAAKE